MSIPRITEILERFGKGKTVFSGSGNTAIKYTKTNKAKSWRSVSITNDGTSDLRFQANGLTVTVQSGEYFDDNFQDFTELEILDNVAYRIILRQ
jgi:hypothetical protein